VTKIATDTPVKRETATLYRGKPLVVELHAGFMTISRKRERSSVVAEMKERAAQQPPTVGTPAPAPSGKPWTTFKGMIECFTAQHQRLGDAAYYAVLSGHNVKHANEFKSSQAALECYAALQEAGNSKEVAA
jgi:hypothetical protein